MKTSIISLAVLATAVSAQFDGIPSCAQKCVSDSVKDNKIAGCQLIDIACVCKSGGFLDAIGCCVSKACDAQGQAAVISFANSICSGTGAVLPTKAECKPGETGASSAGSSAAGASSTSSSGSSGSGSSTSAPAGSTGSGSSTSAAAASASPSKAAAPVAGPAGVFGAIAGLALAL